MSRIVVSEKDYEYTEMVASSTQQCLRSSPVMILSSPTKRPRRSARLAAHTATLETPSPISNLPADLLVLILGFHAPKSDSYYRWTWMHRMSCVCPYWKMITHLYFKPNHLYLDFLYYSDPEKERQLYDDAPHEALDELSLSDRIPFLESFLTDPNATKGITFVMLNNGLPYDMNAVLNESIQSLLRCLFCTPGILTDLTKLAILCIDHLFTEQIAFGLIHSGTVLQQLAIAHPRLDYVYLDGCFPWSLKISPAQWTTVCSRLNLKTLILGGASFLTDDHLKASAAHLEKVSFLCLDHCGTRGSSARSRISDAGLLSLAKHCTNVQHLALKTMHNITELGLEALLRNNPNIEGLDLESSHNMTIRASTVIRQCTPRLKHLKVLHSDWFTDEALAELLSERSTARSNSIKVVACRELVHLNIRCTPVTPSGLRHVLATHLLSSSAAIDIGYSTDDLNDATLIRPGLKYAALEQLVDADDLETLRSTVEARKAELLCLSQDYNITFATKV